MEDKKKGKTGAPEWNTALDDSWLKLTSLVEMAQGALMEACRRFGALHVEDVLAECRYLRACGMDTRPARAEALEIMGFGLDEGDLDFLDGLLAAEARMIEAVTLLDAAGAAAPENRDMDQEEE